MGNLELESELLGLLGGDQKACIAARYYGLDGLGGTTLQVAGAEAGVTAERVRQVVNAVEHRLNQIRPRAPMLDKALAFVAQQAPGWAHEIEPAFPAEGISKLPFRIEGILRAAELFGRTASFSLTETPRGRLIHAGSVQSLETVIRTARHAIERCGVTTVSAVLNEVREVEPKSADRRLISAILTSVEDLRWLDTAHGWFWLPGVPRNPVVRRIRKVLSVSNPVAFGELYAGVAREYRLQSAAPPEHAIRELCAQIPGLTVQGDEVSAAPAIDRGQVLSGVEAAIVDALLENGKVMRCADLVSFCLARGLNRSSFYSSLSHSSVIAPWRQGVMRLIGAAPADENCPKPAGRLARRLRPSVKSHKIRFAKYRC